MKLPEENEYAISILADMLFDSHQDRVDVLHDIVAIASKELIAIKS